MLWNNSIELDVISYSDHHISFKVSGGDDNESWLLSGLYGWPEANNKTLTWDLLIDIKPNAFEPWIVVGDFNSILWPSEKKGGNSKPCHEMNKF